MARSNRSAEKEAFWRLVLDEFRQSGLTVREFCQREGLAEASFYAWRKKIKTRDQEPVADDAKQPPKLVPVDVVDAAAQLVPPDHQTSLPLLEVITPGGFTLRFQKDVELPRLRALLGVVAGCQDGGRSC